MTKEQNAMFRQVVKDRKENILPQLLAAIRPFNYIVDELSSLETLNIEDEPLGDEYENTSQLDLSIEKFRYYFSEKSEK